MDHFADSFWLGQNEDPMLKLLDFIEAGGPVEELPAVPEDVPEESVPDATGFSCGKSRVLGAGST